jgi:hypothetical protein
MKKLIILLSLGFLTSCTKPILEKNEYQIIDTLYVSRNGFNQIIGYDVIVKFDSSNHYGRITNDGVLTYMNPRKIELCRIPK